MSKWRRHRTTDAADVAADHDVAFDVAAAVAVDGVDDDDRDC